MRIAKNIPYLLIIVSIILIIFEFSRNNFQINDTTLNDNIVSILLLIVGIGLLFNINKTR
ncbi:hypothetical protein ACFQH0_01010 [Frigoriflavimonas asaccharolytica]